MSTIITPETVIHGSINLLGDILLHGKVEGDVITNGDVRSSRGSEILGDVQGHNAFISGVVKGDLLAKNKVILGKGARLTGRLEAVTLIIEEGAVFEGNCSMFDENKVETEPDSPTEILKDE